MLNFMAKTKNQLHSRSDSSGVSLIDCSVIYRCQSELQPITCAIWSRWILLKEFHSEDKRPTPQCHTQQWLEKKRSRQKKLQNIIFIDSTSVFFFFTHHQHYTAMMEKKSHLVVVLVFVLHILSGKKAIILLLVYHIFCN